MKRFNDYILLREAPGDMGGPAGGAMPPSSPMGGGIPGGLGGPPLPTSGPGMGPGGPPPMGGGGPPMGGMNMGGLGTPAAGGDTGDQVPPKELKSRNIWSLLEKILSQPNQSHQNNTQQQKEPERKEYKSLKT